MSTTSRLNEIVKNFLSPPVKAGLSSDVKKSNILNDLSGENTYPNTGSFFDDTNNFFAASDVGDVVLKQKKKIMEYRKLAGTPDVVDALDEIVNEIIFVFDNKTPIKLDINEENDKLVEAITAKFEKILGLMNIKRNFYNIVRNSYIDGQIILHVAYDKNTKNGIKSIKMIEPCMLYFDATSNTYKYMREDRSGIQTQNDELYSIEEIVREDFGLHDGKITLSYLEHAIKPANMLTTLEDLLIPLRFSRSISRRVFNVDIGDLPSKRGAEVMRDYQKKFKYKKFYNNSTGEVSNQQHITSMVEDYWFANRSGGKGTTVDVLDETGNLGELNDILYFSKKLYKSLKIPDSRISINPDADKDFNYDDTRTTKDDMKFFMFISRIRQVYADLFKALLKLEIISTNIMKESEWEDKKNDINITFINENSFIQKMKLDNFMSQLDIYGTAQDYAGKLFSVEKILKTVFKYTEEEIQNEFKQIQKEEKNKLFAKFYKSDDY